MKMPTKAELVRLQQLYHTDKRIAEALGGNVTEHLVQYWRRKKGIPRKQFPKYSELQIRELWERYGDDFRCGRELGLSKAGFYSWRRRYGIKERPRALKLEQLELRFGAEPKMGRNGLFVEYYRTVAEKILARCADIDVVEKGQQIDVTPDMLIVDPENLPGKAKIPESSDFIAKTYLITGIGIKDRKKNLSELRNIDWPFALLRAEELQPNMLIAYTDRSSSGLSAVSSLSLKLSGSQLSDILDSGKFTITVPSVIRLTLQGRLQKGVSAFDIFSYALSQLSGSLTGDKLIEYSGNVVEKLDIYERISLCHLTQASGSLCGYTVFDEITRKFLSKRGKVDSKVLFSDTKAHYSSDYVLTVSGLEPHAMTVSDTIDACPVSSMTVPEEVGTVFIGGPCGGGLEQIRQVADVLKGRQVNSGTRLLVSPLTQDVYLEAMRRRFLMPIAEAGGIILAPNTRIEDALDSKDSNVVLQTPLELDKKHPENHLFVSHLTAAESAVSGKLMPFEQ